MIHIVFLPKCSCINVKNFIIPIKLFRYRLFLRNDIREKEEVVDRVLR